MPGSPSVASTVLLDSSLAWFTTRSVTKATPIQFIDDKSHIRNREAVKLPYPVITHAFHVTCY